MRNAAKSSPAVLALLLLFIAPATHAQSIPTFQHIIVIVQENRTPDNLFGSNPTFEPGVEIQTPAAGPWCLGACFNPIHTNKAWNNDRALNWCNPAYVHTEHCTTQTKCNGQYITGPPNCAQETYVSGTDDTSVVYPYFDIATKYGFANYFFQTNQGPPEVTAPRSPG
jgi:Phosphoesterase family